ncbi:multidrug efflux MFS transporter [Weissella diestrammenae]|uniref:Multidrug efflux MFS transporter n=1 Tax=Weissella diestrammenae TaxID=1162633 RepID=A0A7G9T677_9LACO|nr:MDR family MFS transporter [Weissella diestrammenae]MCM0583355.1 multidrug efflux MFS transporter [Weissella diestrammenae]QNN75602.1 multidrug efflux MFS transporter [Weissella diestrammenae]
MTENTNQALDIHGKPYSRVTLIVIILFATFAGMLNQTSLGTALPTLMKDFDITMATAQQATTWFLLVNGIMVPVSAFLMTKFPTKWLYQSAYALLFAGMLLSALTPADKDYWMMFIAGRALQAMAVGITMPLMQLVMVNVFPPEKRGAVMGLGGLVIGMAPAIGPTLSGWILEKDHTILGLTLSNSWRSIFVFPLIVLGLALVLGFFFLKDVIPNRNSKLDWLSLALSTLGFGSFLWGFTNVASDGWGAGQTVILPILFGIGIIGLFIWRQLVMPVPFLNVRVFMNKQFTLTTLSVSLAMMAMMGVEMMLPLYMQNVHGLTPLESGIALLPGALMMGIISPIAGIAYDKVGAKRLARVGFLILAIGTLPFLFLGIDTPVHFITLLYALRMFGIAMVMMPLTASAMSALPIEQSANGTASNNTARQIASAVVVALLTSVTQNIISHQTPVHSLQVENPIKYAAKMAQASLDGFHVSFAIGLGFALLGFLVANFLAGMHKSQVVDLQTTEEGESL